MKSSNPRWIFVTMRNTLVWQGRSRRAEAWWYTLVPALVAMVVIVINNTVFVGDFGDVEVPEMDWYAEWTVFYATVIPGISGAVRRLHDLGRSGWWYLLLALPVAVFLLAPTGDDGTTSDAEFYAILLTLPGALILLYWFMQRGTIGENRFGPDPLMADDSRSPAPVTGIAATGIPIAQGLQ